MRGADVRHFGLYIASLIAFTVYDTVMTPRAAWRAYRSGRSSEYWYNLAVARDQYSNAKAGGDPDQTVSGENGVHLENGAKGDLSVRVWFCKVLGWAFGERDHCKNSIDRGEMGNGKKSRA